MTNYSYMSNFNFNPAYIGAGAALGLGAGMIATGNLKDYKEGNAGDWRDKLLRNAAIGAGVGALGGAGAGLLLRSGKIHKYTTPHSVSSSIETPSHNPNTKPIQPVPVIKSIEDLDRYMMDKPGYMSTSEIEAKLNDPNHEWII